MILNATRTVAETEDVATEITDELGRNRSKIESSQSKVNEFTGIYNNLIVSNNILLLNI